MVDNPSRRNASRQRVLTFLDAFYAGDAAVAQSCCVEDYDSITYAPVEIFPHLGHKQGNDWIAESIRIQQQRYRQRRYEVTGMVVEDDMAVALLRLGLQKRNDDRMVQLDTAEVFTLRGGLIAKHRAFFDSFDLIQQLLGHDLTDAFAVNVRGAMQR